MAVTLESLQGMGAFANAPVEKAIKWQQGADAFEATVFIRPLSYQAAVATLATHENAAEDAIAARIAASVCDEAGKPILSVADIKGEASPERGALNASLTYALLAAIGEVNSAGKS